MDIPDESGDLRVLSPVGSRQGEKSQLVNLNDRLAAYIDVSLLIANKYNIHMNAV